MLNVLNGTLDIGIGEIQELRSQLDAGKITLLATFNPKRIAEKPDVPTVKELGFDVRLVKFRGLAGPKGDAGKRHEDLGRGRAEASGRSGLQEGLYGRSARAAFHRAQGLSVRSSTTSPRRPKDF